MAVDSYSKWISAMVVRSSTTNVTIEQLRMLFAEHGLPETIVTDNATCFTSAEFRLFMSKNCIQPITSPAYHPSSNGLAERAVQLVKRGPGDAVYVRNHTENSPMWIPAVLKEMHNDLLVSEAPDCRRLRRHSNHVRLRHADARILADVAAPAEITKQPTVTSRVKTILPYLATTTSSCQQRNRLFADRRESGKLRTDNPWSSFRFVVLVVTMDVRIK